MVGQCGSLERAGSRPDLKGTKGPKAPRSLSSLPVYRIAVKPASAAPAPVKLAVRASLNPGTSNGGAISFQQSCP